ncbi:MAG: helix-turn-helix transcriptional regulator [Scytonema sp. PMC 1069.18]|nr:helix-turn-helix transcriptional regulator [Scytonema sp. PMC 1069.18]MEC4886771.1 helix-turn-helix transcriptional regulator [Scytonema sp. PMC 1070.18]
MPQQVHHLFKQAMDRYGVRGKELAAIAGITPNHLSDFRSGKKWVGPDVFMALLEGMEQLSPGSRRYFCQLLAEESSSEKKTDDNFGEKLIEMIEAADDDTMEAAMIAIGRKWKKIRQNPAMSNGYTSGLDSAIAV